MTRTFGLAITSNSDLIAEVTRSDKCWDSGTIVGFALFNSRIKTMANQIASIYTLRDVHFCSNCGIPRRSRFSYDFCFIFSTKHREYGIALQCQLCLTQSNTIRIYPFLICTYPTQEPLMWMLVKAASFCSPLLQTMRVISDWTLHLPGHKPTSRNPVTLINTIKHSANSWMLSSDTFAPVPRPADFLRTANIESLFSVRNLRPCSRDCSLCAPRLNKAAHITLITAESKS